jgi:hypothetical protein
MDSLGGACKVWAPFDLLLSVQTAEGKWMSTK